MTYRPFDVKEGKPIKDDLTARAELLALGLTNDQLLITTGMGLRRGHHSPTASVLRKYADGSLSAIGVMSVVFGTDSPQHHAGHNLSEVTS